jgi:hypothetical protein
LRQIVSLNRATLAQKNFSPGKKACKFHEIKLAQDWLVE